LSGGLCQFLNWNRGSPLSSSLTGFASGTAGTAALPLGDSLRALIQGTTPTSSGGFLSSLGSLGTTGQASDGVSGSLLELRSRSGLLTAGRPLSVQSLDPLNLGLDGRVVDPVESSLTAILPLLLGVGGGWREFGHVV
jgi:hypothetical protein